MKKVTLLCPPGLKNIGNDFIARGAEEFLKECGYSITKVSLLNTSDSILYAHASSYVSDYDKKIIKESDLLVFAGGSCFSRHLTMVYDQICEEFDKNFIILGSSFYEHGGFLEREYKDVSSWVDILFTRDRITWERLSNDGEHENVIRGLDMAFFMDVESVLPISSKRDYVVFNIDSPYDICNELKERYKDEKFYICFNDTSKIEMCGKIKNTFVSEKWYDYIRFFAGAKKVYTNRVHTFLACFLTNTPCVFHKYKSGDHPRLTLFEEIGMRVVDGKLYTKKDYEKIDIKQIKHNFKKLFKESIKKYL